MVLIVLRSIWLAQTDNLIFDSDLIALLPSVSNSPLIEEMDRRASVEVKSNIIAIIQSDSFKKVDLATDEMSNLIRQGIEEGNIAAVLIDGPDVEELSDRVDAMLGYKDRLIGDVSRQRIQDSIDAQFRWRVDRVTQFPPSNLTDPVLDPLGTLEEFIEERIPRIERVQFDGLYFRVDDKIPSNVLLIKLGSDEIGGGRSGMSIAHLYKIQQIIEQDLEVKIFYSGIPLHAEQTKQATVKEISWMGPTTLVLTLIFFLFITRSLKALVVTTSSIALAVLGGVVIAQGTVGLPHLIGLMMTTTVIGICVDFSFHFWIHVRSGKSGMEAISAIKRAVNMSFVTTFIGLLAIFLISVPVLANTAVFISGALLMSWLLVMFVFPLVAGSTKHSTNTHARQHVWHDMIPKKIAVGFVLVMCVIATAGFALKYHVDDRPIRLGRANDNLVEHDRRVNELLGHQEEGTLYLMQAQSESLLLQAEDELLSSLLPDEFHQVKAVSRLVVSDRQQTKNQALFDEVKRNIHATSANEYLSILGAPAFDWQSQPSQPYSLRWVVAQPWASIERNHVLACDDTLCATTVSAVGSATAKLDVACQGVDECSRISFSERQTTSFYNLRIELLWSLLMAACAMFAVMYCRYRNEAFRLFLVPLIASATGVAAIVWAGMPVTSFTLAVIFPLLGLSVDYAIFSHESGGNSRQTSSAIFASAITTMISFSILAFSGTAAVKFFAIPVAVGITMAWATTYILRPNHPPTNIS